MPKETDILSLILDAGYDKADAVKMVADNLIYIKEHPNCTVMDIVCKSCPLVSECKTVLRCENDT